MYVYSCPQLVLISARHHAPVSTDLIDPYLQKLFETGVDEMSWDDMDELQDCNFPWPDVAEAQAFRLKVRVVLWLCGGIPHPSVTWQSLWFSCQVVRAAAPLLRCGLLARYGTASVASVILVPCRVVRRCVSGLGSAGFVSVRETRMRHGSALRLPLPGTTAACHSVGDACFVCFLVCVLGPVSARRRSRTSSVR